jgi:WD40 repeat protein
VAVPAVPYRGIQPFRYVDHAIFLAREEETEDLVDLVAIYRGVLLYGASGDGKSSLINAGLLPAAARRRLHPERVRVQPRAGEEIVIERIATTEGDGGEHLPSLLAPDGDESSRIVVSAQAFESRVREACETHRPLLIFDQFEEIITLFEDDEAVAAQRGIVEMLVRLLREPLAVKLLFVFREDYLSKVKHLLAAVPELVDQALRLEPISADALPTIIRGPFERHPGHFERELDVELAERVCAALEERFGSADLSLSEVETVALRLWESDDPQTLLADRGVQGILEDYLGEALDEFSAELRAAAIALLAQMVTSAGTRNVISAEDLVQRVREEDPDLSPPLLSDALERLERESRLIRRERRHDIYLYEITSEFLVPWISQRREEARLVRERRRDERRRERERARQRFVVVVSIAAVLVLAVALVGVLAVWALGQRSDARRQATRATSLALASSATPLLNSRPDVSLLLALGGYNVSPAVETRSSVLAALEAALDPGVVAILHGHTDRVRSVAFGPDGRTLASASNDNTVRLWDVRTHKQLGRPLTGHGDVVRSVAFSPDGRTLASASDDNTIRLWDARTHEQLGNALIGPPNAASNPEKPLRPHGFESVAFSRDGRALASGSVDDTVRLWSVRTHRQLGASLRGHTDGVTSVAFSPSGRMLASAGEDKTVRLWSLRTHKQLGAPLTGHTRTVTSVAFGPNGRTLASSSADKTMRLWNLRTHKQLGAALIGHTAAIYSVVFTSHGRTLTSASADKTVRSWSVRTHKQLGRLIGHTGAVFGVAVSRNGRTLASASADKTMRLWDMQTHEQLGKPLGRHMGPVLNVEFSPDGRTLASAGLDDTVRLWDVRTHKHLGKPLISGVLDVAFSPDGRTLASGSSDSTVRLWDVRTHKQLGPPLKGHTDIIIRVAFSPHGRTLASASYDGTVRLWDVRTHKQLGSPLKGHSGGVYDVAFSPDGRTLASASYDRTVRVWNLRTHKQLGRALTGHKGAVASVAFGANGRTLASAGSDSTVRVWDVRTHKQLGQPLTGHTDTVFDVAFSPDGRTLASASFDGTVRVWDARTHHALGSPLNGHSGRVYGVAFSPDGRTLASGGGDGTVRVWDKIFWRNLAELQTRVCDLVGTGLSRSEWAQYANGIPYRESCP